MNEPPKDRFTVGQRRALAGGVIGMALVLIVALVVSKLLGLS